MVISQGWSLVRGGHWSGIVAGQGCHWSGLSLVRGGRWSGVIVIGGFYFVIM